MKVDGEHALLFLALSSFIDEASTFIHISMGGYELNPRVAYLININPLLYPIGDVALILGFWAVDRTLSGRVDGLWLVWAAGGVARLVCLAFSLGGF